MGFDELYQLYFKDIYRYLLSLSKDIHLSEEITQETFYKAIQNLDQFDGRKDIRAWLFTIAKNTYLSHQKKQVHLSLDSAIREIPSDINFVDRIMDEEQCFEIHRYLHTMSEPYKEVFNLRVFGELPFERIGLIFGKSAGWARVTYHRARKMIIEYMEGMENGKDKL